MQELRVDHSRTGLKTYGDFIPESRAQELELHALHLMTGEDIRNTLEAENPKLAEEYDKVYD
jgi:hypothetical protein